MKSEIVSKIEQRLQQRARLEREMLVIDAEIRTYEEVLKYLSDAVDLPPASDAQVEPQKARISRARAHKVGDVWLQILKEFRHQHPQSFSIDDIVTISELMDLKTTRGNIRSQMAAFVTRGILERIDLGVFKMTDEGLRQIDLAEKSAQSSLNEHAEDRALEKTVP